MKKFIETIDVCTVLCPRVYEQNFYSLITPKAGISLAYLLVRIKKLSQSVDVSLFEPQHDKTNKMPVCPAKTQISLGIRPV